MFVLFALGAVLLSCQKDTGQEDVSTFIQKLPVSVQSQILWFCDFEDQTFKKWEDEGTGTVYAGGGIFVTDPRNSSYGIVSSFKNSGRYSAFATIQNAVRPGETKAVRFMRWTDKAWNIGGRYFPEEAYYSVFLLLDYPYNPAKDPNNDPYGDGGWWNIFQFKSENNAGSQPVVELDLYNQNGAMCLGLIVKDYQDDYSSAHLQEYVKQTTPLPLKVGYWNHIEMYVRKASGYTGTVMVWQNGVKLFEKNNLRTVLPPDDTVVWGIGNYTDYVTGGPVRGTATIYFDDAIVSRVRIGAYVF